MRDPRSSRACVSRSNSSRRGHTRNSRTYQQQQQQQQMKKQPAPNVHVTLGHSGHPEHGAMPLNQGKQPCLQGQRLQPNFSEVCRLPRPRLCRNQVRSPQSQPLGCAFPFEVGVGEAEDFTSGEGRRGIRYSSPSVLGHDAAMTWYPHSRMFSHVRHGEWSSLCLCWLRVRASVKKKKRNVRFFVLPFRPFFLAFLY